MPWHIQPSHEEDIITLNYPSHPDERVGTPPLNPHRGILVLAVCVLLLVPGAAAVTIVLNDGPASLSLAATPDGSVAVAVIAASQPSGYSATLSARDTGGVAAGQESTVTGAREILAVTAAFNSQGESAVTQARVGHGNLTTTQLAATGPGVWASQSTRATGAYLATTSTATDTRGHTASQGLVVRGDSFFDDSLGDGTLEVDQYAGTGQSAVAMQQGTGEGLAVETRGLAMHPSADPGAPGTTSSTHGLVQIGSMTFENHATATGTATSASQDIVANALFSRAATSSSDAAGRYASQQAFVGMGELQVSQEANTTASAAAMQAGVVSGGFAALIGQAEVPSAEPGAPGASSFTYAGMEVGNMIFASGATATGTGMSASQALSSTGMFQSAIIASSDAAGRAASQQVSVTVGELQVSQEANTTASAAAMQAGTLSGDTGILAGSAYAPSADPGTSGESSFTNARLTLGNMTFASDAIATGTGTSASQDLLSKGLFLSALAGSEDSAGWYASQQALVGMGELQVSQEANTTASAAAMQVGNLSGEQGFLDGRAGLERGSDTGYAYGSAGVASGTIAFENHALAAASIPGVSQSVTITGVNGSAEAAGRDGAHYAMVLSNFTQEGSLTMDQVADTRASAYAYQNGIITTSGDALSYMDAGSDLGWVRRQIVVTSSLESGVMVTESTAFSSDEFTFADHTVTRREGVLTFTLSGTRDIHMPLDFATAVSGHGRIDATMTVWNDNWTAGIFIMP